MSELREALEAAVEEHNEPATTESAPASASATPEAPPPASAPEQTADLAASPSSKEPVADPDKPVAEKPAEDKPAPEQTVEQARAAHRVNRPPASWTKEAKGEWAAMPLHVRQEVYKRESEINRVLQEAAPLREQMREINETITPYMARIQSAGVTPVQAMNELFKADYVLATGTRQNKAQMMAKLIQDYDVSIEDLDAAIVASINSRQQPAAPQGFDPNYVNQLVQQQLQQALAPIYQERQQREQAVVQQAAQTVDQMALNPQFPYFDDVREEMGDLIEVAAKRGIALSLEDAYHKAVTLSPVANEQQSRQAAMTNANSQHQQAQRAKAAASSVSGAPASGGLQTFTGDGSMRGAIEAAFNNARV
jgi:hypothetical protein